jgi:hypothetical protein
MSLCITNIFITPPDAILECERPTCARGLYIDGGGWVWVIEAASNSTEVSVFVDDDLLSLIEVDDGFCIGVDWGYKEFGHDEEVWAVCWAYRSECADFYSLKLCRGPCALMR